jgi:FkbM family methyltransferase
MVLTKRMFGKIRRAYNTVRENGFEYFVQKYAYAVPSKLYKYRKKRIDVERMAWRDINFKALGINASAKLLLNPSDSGFSKEFGIYGFREPLNTLAVFNKVAKERPFVLDIGGNLGYFSLVELEAGARNVVAVEPVPSTFALLAKTLKGYQNAEAFNLAVSDGQDFLKLYVGKNRNVTSASELLLKATGHEIHEEISAKAATLAELANRYPATMIRMDIEGYEFSIFSKDVPDQIKTICIELHILPPYNKSQAVKLLKKLGEQGFRTSVIIKEMSYDYYPIVNYLGLKTAYKIAVSLTPRLPNSPYIKTNPTLNELISTLPESKAVHLILER